MSSNDIKILVYPNDYLRKRAGEVDFSDGSDRRPILKAMSKIMRETKCSGLAANQLEYWERIILVKDDNGNDLFLFNPEITKAEGEVVGQEGCLSFPGVVVYVKRPQKITVSAYDENGNMTKKEYSDFSARVICHEIDHINGKMIIDYCTLYDRNRISAQMKKMNRAAKRQAKQKAVA